MGVTRGLLQRNTEGLEQVGRDEKSFGKSQAYISVLRDLDNIRVLAVTPGNDTESERKLWRSIPQEQRAEVKAAAMDMGAGFTAATQIEVPWVEIVYAKYHVSALRNKAVNAVRYSEHKALMLHGDERLKGSRQLWLYDPVNLDDVREEILAALAAENLQTTRAWMHKEIFREIWTQASQWEREGYFKEWYNRAMRSQLEPIKKVASKWLGHIHGDCGIGAIAESGQHAGDGHA